MKQKMFKLVADLRFAIFILLLISLFSIIGTVIEQDQTIEFYKTTYPLASPVFNILTWEIILRLGLDHVYRTWWFFLLIFLFGLSLISCTFLQQLPSLIIARRCQFFRNSSQFSKLKNFVILNNYSVNQLLLKIKKSDYSIFQQKNIAYCYKGLTGRIAPVLVHFSMILILLGTIIGALFGFKAQESVPKTEIFHIENVLSNGQLSFIPRASARINDFWITYTKNRLVSQFYSDLAILDNEGAEISRKTLSVNYPLIHDNVYYYQTDWNLIGLRLQLVPDTVIEYPLLNILNNQNKVWLTWIATSESLEDGFIALVDNLEGYCSIYDETGVFLGNIELNETAQFNLAITFLEIISSTGLQIKSDPGIPIIYAGFFFLMVSTLISYITYSQIWIFATYKNKEKKLLIGGTTNRALFEFELEFLKFVQ